VVLDTNVLLSYPDVLDQYDNVLIPVAVLEELDGLKKAAGELGFQARQAIRKLENCGKASFALRDTFKFIPDGWNPDSRDNKIILTAKDHEIKLISNDLNVRIKCKALGVETESYLGSVESERYRGYKEITLNQDEQAKYYSSHENVWGILENEYLILRDKESSQIIDVQVFTSEGFRGIDKQSLDSLIFGKVRSKDVYQSLAIDSLFNANFSLLTGKAGSAKTLLSLAYVFQQLQKGKFDKLTVLFNPVGMSKSSGMGFYPGTRTEKLLQTSLGGILASKLGGLMPVEALERQGKLELIPVCDARGFETTANGCLYVTEAQNLDSYLLKTILQRAKEGTKVIIEGDSCQVDSANFENEKNGMFRAIEVFKGTPEFSCVELKNIYRSRIAEIADSM
jgi:predicted ribonuclease YlaK